MMEDIELVIKISKEDYERLKEYKKAPFYSLSSRTYEAIANGIPLPKGHGRLIDVDKLAPDCQEDVVYYDDDEHNVFTAVGIAQIECADTIIEADKTESEERDDKESMR